MSDNTNQVLPIMGEVSAKGGRRGSLSSFSFFKTASPDRYSLLKEFARENRKHPTEAENALWTMINGINLGVRFRRQHVIYDYIADFVCLEKKLIIEVDGAYHYTEEQMEYDVYRTEALERLGYKVMRFKNEEVLFDTVNVVNTIIDELNNITYIIK